ncbi:MAG: hypothetical protein AB8B82_05895 [Roseovarius sp.]
MEASLLLIPIGALLVSVWMAYSLTRAQERILVLVLIVGAVASGVWAVWMANQQSGYGGLGYVAFAYGVSAPSCLGLLIGWLTGWGLGTRARRRVEEYPPDE